MGNLLELPLIMQDGALFGGLASGGLGLSLDRGCELAKFLIDRVREVGGVLTVLCHPTSNKQAGKMRREWIRRIIEHALAEGARFLTIAEIGEMWRRIGGGIEQFMQGIDAQDFFAWLESRGLCAG
ncbi:MAG: hypothetical protein D6771_09465 [Zetaproteobacteria bacterium]|nr:MAG: hypothetical protein D6771_09465 [Zetaproteobacteria bacterium]